MQDDRSVGLWKVLFAGEIDKTCLGKYVENHMFNNVEICLMWSTLLVCTKTYYLEMYGSRNQSNFSCYSLSQSCPSTSKIFQINRPHQDLVFMSRMRKLAAPSLLQGFPENTRPGTGSTPCIYVCMLHRYEHLC